MEAKDKAKELITRFEFIDLSILTNPESVYKQCALICVEEITNSPKIVLMSHFNYWQDVKQEIEKY